ncbi:MAG: hypothetical protein SPI15_08655 [Candidatus Faecousia sp.]|nr:hypothetical protein [Clostridiales bacterium]MDY6180911.1 hypothetical protein [Candidatus Faecousia sp.]
MTLREQLLSELQKQNEIAQAAIKEQEEIISAEAFARSTITGGPFSSTARSACDSRMQAASTQKNRLQQENAWISEMLSKYR